MTLKKDNQYLTEHDDHYSISVLNINDSLSIDLDKRLHVESDIFISGDLECSDISCTGNIIVNGDVIAKNITGEEIFLMRNSAISGNIHGKKNIQFGKAIVMGTVISNGNILAVSELKVHKDISAAVSLVCRSNAHFMGRVSAGAVLDVAYKLMCEDEIKIAGTKVNKYGRFSDSRNVFIVTDTVLLICVSSGLAEVYENIDTQLAYVHNLSAEPTDKEKSLIEYSPWIKNVAVDIYRGEQ